MKAKKLAAVALSLCLTVPMFSTIVSAADGSLMFSDPQTKVGEEVRSCCEIWKFSCWRCRYYNEL